jgi:hypothetical protein
MSVPRETSAHHRAVIGWNPDATGHLPCSRSTVSVFHGRGECPRGWASRMSANRRGVHATPHLPDEPNASDPRAPRATHATAPPAPFFPVQLRSTAGCREPRDPGADFTSHRSHAGSTRRRTPAASTRSLIRISPRIRGSSSRTHLMTGAPPPAQDRRVGHPGPTATTESRSPVDSVRSPAPSLSVPRTGAEDVCSGGSDNRSCGERRLHPGPDTARPVLCVRESMSYHWDNPVPPATERHPLSLLVPPWVQHRDPHISIPIRAADLGDRRTHTDQRSRARGRPLALHAAVDHSSMRHGDHAVVQPHVSRETPESYAP